MNNLISFGDSFIWGLELRDCANCSPTGYSLHTFPALLAKFNNMKYHCFAYPGNSNEAISRSILDVCENYDPGEIFVFAQWTFSTRYEFRKNDSWISINSWDARKLFDDENSEVYKNRRHYAKLNNIENFARSYFEFNNSEYWEVYKTLKEIVFATMYLNQKNIPYLFTVAENQMVNSYTAQHPDHTIATLKNNINNDHFYWFPPGHGVNQTQSPRGFYQWARENKYSCGDGGHPLEQAHQDAANLIQGKFHEMVKKHLESDQTRNSIS